MDVPAMIGAAQVTLGPLATATINLPPDVTGEVVLERVTAGAPCGLPPVTSPGIIIDDLRAE
jgi:hypothetical protein